MRWCTSSRWRPAAAGLAPLLDRLRLPGSSLAKMPVRNLARTPRRTLMSLLGIARTHTPGARDPVYDWGQLHLSGDRDVEQGVFLNNDVNRTSIRTNFTFNPVEQLDFAIREVQQKINKAKVMLGTGKLSNQGYAKYATELKAELETLKSKIAADSTTLPSIPITRKSSSSKRLSGERLTMRPLSLIGSSALGCISFCISRSACFTNSSRRIIFTPPAVDPEQPTTKPESTIMAGT